jgi:replicative DNA helicase
MSAPFNSSTKLTNTVFLALEARSSTGESITGIRTGYAKIDTLTAGLRPSDLIIIAARPSMGKTALALDLIMRAAVRGKVPAAIFSLELSAEALMRRMLGAWGKLDKLEDSDWRRLIDASAELAEAPIYIDDTPCISPLEIRAKARRLKDEKGIGLVVVDYLQLLRGSTRTESRRQEILEISWNLQTMADELNVPVIALAQLSRKLEYREDKRLLLLDLDEFIEQYATLIMSIYREEAYRPFSERQPGHKAEIAITKNRSGPWGTVDLLYFSDFTSFEEMYSYWLLGGKPD